MSRHRNVRNLTEDDYYDDYDDYDDDYYEEDDDHEVQNYYSPPPKQYQQAPAARVQPPTAATTPKEPSMAEKERQLIAMGFSNAQAKTALGETKGDVQRATDLLLQASAGGGPPPGFSKPPSTNDTSATVQASSKTALATSGRLTPPPKKSVTFTANKSATKTPTADYGPLPKLPDEVLENLKQSKSQLTLVVLGHVDAGKSTLMGQVLLQLGHVQKRTVQKYQKQAAELGKASFALAWVLDEDESERQRGVTMEVATKFISTANHNLVILDAPGHKDFVPSAITGAASADVGILVVAATRGEFEAGFDSHKTGQTREHVVLARGLGVSQLVVAVNKLDAVENSQERFEEIQQRLLPFLTSNGFNPKRVRFVPISGLTGENVKARSSEGLSWYKGPTLLEAMDSFVPAQRNVDKPLRAIVMDVCMEGKNVTCRCRLVQGVVQMGDKLVVLPIGDEAAVSRIDHHGASDNLKFAMSGDTVDLVLSGIDIARVTTGCILSHPHLPLRPPVKKKMQAKILVMEQLQVPIIRGAQVLFHMHSIDVPASISKLVSTNKRDGSILKANPRVVTGGSSATVEITLQEKVCLETFADCRALGRFVLRRGGDSIAVGIIEKVL